jgi:hypothetical protein
MRLRQIAIGCVHHTPTVLFATSLSFHEMFRLTFVLTNAHDLRYGKGGVLDFAQFRELMIVLIGDTGNKDSTAESFKLIAKGHPVRTHAHAFFLHLFVSCVRKLALTRHCHTRAHLTRSLTHTRTNIHTFTGSLLLGVASARHRAAPHIHAAPSLTEAHAHSLPLPTLHPQARSLIRLRATPPTAPCSLPHVSPVRHGAGPHRGCASRAQE